VSNKELDQYYTLRLVTGAELSDEPLPSYDTAIGWLRDPASGQGSFQQWAAYSGGCLIGLENIILPGRENQRLGMMLTMVHPDFRCRGIATKMLKFSVPALRELDRTHIEGWAIQKGGSGEKWATGLGFAPVHVTVIQSLSIDTADVRLWEVPAPAGYRTVAWTGAAPGEFVASYARTRNAIHDAPVGDIAYQLAQWTVERVRQAEQDKQADDIEHRVVAAVSERDDEIVGFTEVELRPHRSDRALQGETAVVAEHRGHGLGRCIKARMARWLRSDRPALERVLTSTAASNTHMIRINHEVGYTTSRTTLVMSCSLPNLETRLGP
jgi:GNAT superfamily N-acetyltransferase